MYSFQVFMYSSTVVRSVTSTDARADSASGRQRVIRPRLLTDTLPGCRLTRLTSTMVVVVLQPKSAVGLAYMGYCARTLATSRYYSLFE